MRFRSIAVESCFAVFNAELMELRVFVSNGNQVGIPDKTQALVPRIRRLSALGIDGSQLGWKLGNG